MTVPLFWSDINPYGTCRLEMDTRLDLTPHSGPRRTGWSAASGGSRAHAK
ncbi:hypothetical protein ABZY36_36350 [Streptomyces sp. NPDC006627]